MAHRKQTAGVILAAGMSQRFGQPKQLSRLENKYLLEWVLDTALASRLAKVVLVLGNEHEKILQALGVKTNLPRLQTVINPRYSEGQSRSLQAGLKMVHQVFYSVMFLLGDQPRLQSGTIDYLLTRFWNSEKNICVPVYRGVRGNRGNAQQKRRLESLFHLLDRIGDGNGRLGRGHSVNVPPS